MKKFRLPSWSAILKIMAILSWAMGAVWMIFQPGFEPVLTFIAGTTSFISSFFASDAPINERLRFTLTAEQQKRNRQNMLQLVYNTWIKGVLERSLYNQVLIELRMETHPGAVEHPWDMVVRMPDQPDRPLPPGTPMIDVFNEMENALLILGEPGSGKTTMLLELARQAIQGAQQDPDQSAPVIFNLSSWSPKHSLAEWLVEELNSKYFIHKNIAQLWVDSDALCILLDGLDEVKAIDRLECVKAINRFRQEHLIPVVVCCRAAEYAALGTPLQFRGAIVLQPLNDQQVASYLAQIGAGFADLHRLLLQDAELQELARSPLMLNIMTLMYQSLLEASPAALEQGESRRKLLFDAYIQRMLKRRANNPRFSPQATLHWLIWLARKMMAHGQTVFTLEKMRSDWLSSPLQRWSHRLLGGLCVGLVYGLVFGGIAAVNIEPAFGLRYGMAFLLSGGLIGILLGWLETLRAAKRPGHEASWRASRRNSLAAGLVVWAIAGLVLGQIYGLIDGLGLGLMFGLMGGLIFRLHEEPTEVLTWSWRKIKTHFWNGLGIGLVFGLIFGLLIGLIIALLAGPRGIFAGSLAGMLVGGSVGALMSGLESAEVETRNRPGQGLRTSSKNAGIVGLIFWLVGGLSLSLIVWSSLGLVAWLSGQLALAVDVRVSLGLGFGLIFGFIFGLIFGMIFGLIEYGGGYVINHLALRWLLRLSDSLPWRIAGFLDYAADLIFLHKVGGGYIFIHRLLLEHLAEMEPDRAAALAQGAK